MVRGFIEVYGDWITRYGIDGFRIDTAKHVNPEFFQAFIPAMMSRAKAAGIANFHMFGEVYSTDPAVLALHTRVAKLPAVLDFPFAKTVRDVTMGIAGTDALATLFAEDALYEGGEAAALRLPTFVSNHDQGRYGYFLFKNSPDISDQEALQRTELAYAMLFTLRGVPVIYYGDEQGFAGVSDDMGARQDMFASRVASFNSERTIGGRADPGADHFNTGHVLYRALRDLAALRASQPALRRGRQLVRAYSDSPGLFAVSRLDPESGREILIAFNTSRSPIESQVQTQSGEFRSLRGTCEAHSVAGSYHVSLAPLDFVVCMAQ